MDQLIEECVYTYKDGNFVKLIGLPTLLVKHVKRTPVNSDQRISNAKVDRISEIQSLGSRNILFPGGWITATLIEWHLNDQIQLIDGPAVIYNQYTSIIINPGWTAELQKDNNIIIYCYTQYIT